MKATGNKISRVFLEERAQMAIGKGFAKQKWISFCEELLNDGCKIYLHEARTTFSKYIFIRESGREFKVRFSNHRPNRTKEETGDCDFFVGVTHLGITTTNDALKAVREWRSKIENT